jgi:hypothetical protein
VFFPGHFELLMLRHDLAKLLGKTEVAADALKLLNEAALAKPAKDRTALESVALGRAALVLGADAQKVIAQYFKAAQTKDAKLKVQASIQGDLVRVSGGKKDDLQAAMQLVRTAVADVPLQYINLRD